MNENARLLQRKLLVQYYKSAQLAWFHPKTMHWTKIVSQDGFWKWIRTDSGIRARIVRHAPLHIYQTLLRFKTKGPPNGKYSDGYLLGGPVLFEMDLFEKIEQFNLWKLIDTIPMIQELVDFMRDWGSYRLIRLTFSGFRGIHAVFDCNDSTDEPIILNPEVRPSKALGSFIKERRQLARAVGYHCKGWDWKVSEDIWRVIRVPWSIHGSSSLRAIPLDLAYRNVSLEEQLKEASIFSYSDLLNIRIKRNVPLFVFVDGEYYGPYRKGWYTKLPIAVAMYLTWSGFARLREQGPKQVSQWFDRGWQLMVKKWWKRPPQLFMSKEALAE